MPFQRCLLADITDEAFEAVLHQLVSHDYASLRQVSCSVLRRTNEHIPFLVLRLSHASTQQHLQKWFAATKQLQQVKSIHVHLAAAAVVQSSVIAAAMEQLRICFQDMTELQLLAVSDGSTSSWTPDCAYLSALAEPILPLMPRLSALVIANISVQSFLEEIESLARYAEWSRTQKSDWNRPWHVQSLHLHLHQDHEHTHWRDLCSAFKLLAKAFPELKDFSIHFPRVYYDDQRVTGYGGRIDYENDLCDEGSLADYDQRLAGLAVMAALVNATLQLEQLEQLTVRGAPDIWRYRPTLAKLLGKASREKTAAYDRCATSSALGALSSISTAAAALGTMDDVGCVLLRQHTTLKKVHIHAGTVGWSMSWQQQQQQRGAICGNNQTHSALTQHAASTAANISCDVEAAVYDVGNAINEHFLHDPPSDDSSNTDQMYASSNNQRLSAAFDHHISHYSRRLPFEVVRDISSCQLTLLDNEIDSLTYVLSDLKPLKHLEVSLALSGINKNYCRWSCPAAARMVAAAATIPHLESFTLVSPVEQDYYDTFLATEQLLSPLTASAGGPGNRLKRLRLVGRFISATDAADLRAAYKILVSKRCKESGAYEHWWDDQYLDDEAGTCGSATEAQDSEHCDVDANSLSVAPNTEACRRCPTSANASVDDNTAAAGNQHLTAPGLHQPLAVAAPAWNAPLQHLSGLIELELTQMDQHGDLPLLILSVDCLPASLRVFKATRLGLIGTTQRARVAAAVGGFLPVGNNCPQLQKLDLQHCKLTSPCILASQQLQQLIVVDSRWSGGWVAATTAWPNVRNLMCRFSRLDGSSTDGTGNNDHSSEGHRAITKDSSNRTSTTSNRAYSAAARGYFEQAIHEVAVNFAQLRSLSLLELPWWSVEALHPIGQHMEQIRSINVYHARGCDPDGQCDQLRQWLQEQLPWASVGVRLGDV